MMSGRAINYEQASTYYEHTADYYTGHQSHYDKCHGTLSKRLKLTGELSKGAFETFCKNIAEEERRKRIGFDATFSAPKSVSLALAESDERREELIKIHQTAVERVLAEIEKNHLRTRSNGKKLSARNIACGEFVHFLNRNNELDLHSHCVILNQTDTDGKILALDFDKLLEHQKMLGLIYRQELAHELLAAGYELEITNSREGYFELKGFDRETVMAHSTRRQEILAEADRQGAMTAQGKMLANLATRKAKDKSIRYEDVLAEVKQSLYDTGKIKIESHRKEQEPNGKLGRRDDGRGGSFAGRGAEVDKADGRNGDVAQYEHSEASAGQSGFA
ncbi:MAG: relaxase domain-containing protein, partial [Selenomonadaceae bacterium]|nr:relaxase domain-containing protein [Selenomonadaceae bacterium]